MVVKRLIGFVFAGTLAVGLAAAEIVVRIAPPRSVSQKRDRSPGRDYKWIQGHQMWNGGGYVWVPGRWEQPPRPRARWEAHRWKHQKGSWVFVEGRWR